MRSKILVLVLVLGAVACGEDTQDAPVPEFNPLPDPEPGNWLGFRADAGRTGHNPLADTGRAARELWRFVDVNTTDYGAAKGSASVYEDILYVGTDDARFLALDRMSGDVLWRNDIVGTTQGIHGSPAVSADVVYIGAYNGTIYAFDRASGDELWTYTKGFQIGASPLLVPEHGRVYNTHEHADTGGGWVVSVDARTGEEVWAYRIRAHPHSSVAMHVGKGILTVGDNLAKLHGFDASTGEKLWEVDLPQPNDEGGESDIKSTPTVLEDAGLVVVGAWSKYVHAYNVEDGTVAWEYYVGARVMSSAAYAPGRQAVYVGSLSGQNALHAIDATNGRELWTFPTGGGVLSSPAVSGDESLVLVGSGDGNLYAVDAQTGLLAWKHEIGGSVSGSPTLVGEHVYITARKGDLVAIETGAP